MHPINNNVEIYSHNGIFIVLNDDIQILLVGTYSIYAGYPYGNSFENFLMYLY